MRPRCKNRHVDPRPLALDRRCGYPHLDDFILVEVAAGLNFAQVHLYGFYLLNGLKRNVDVQDLRQKFNGFPHNPEFGSMMVTLQ